MFLLITNLYKINSDNTFGGIVESYSDTDIDIKDYVAPLGYTFIPPSKETDVWNGADWTEPYVPSLEELRQAKKDEIAEERFNAEIAGVSGIKTDRESQALLTGACLQSVIDPTYTLNWKTIDGTFVTMTAEQIKAVGSIVRLHVQGCFDEEARLCGLIDLAETAEEISAITWELG